MLLELQGETGEESETRSFGVLIDAFVVRMTIVPAVMYLLGEKAWWLPKWLERILPDVDVEGAKLERSDRSKAGSEELVH